MRRNRNQCPNCNAEVAPNYRFCLACGSELPETEEESFEAEPAPVTEPKVAAAPAEKRSWRRKKAAEPAVPEPTQYSAYGFSGPAEPIKSEKKRRGRKKNSGETSPMISPTYSFMPPPQPQRKKTNWIGGFFQLVLFVAILGGAAVGGMFYWNNHQTNAANKISWEEVQALDYDGIWNKLNRSEFVRPVGVPADAVAARFVKMDDDGTITIRIDAEEMEVHLAGVPMDFVSQCLGDKAMSRIERILKPEMVVFVALDGTGTVSSATTGNPPVYLWRADREDGKLHYTNQELIASGEVAFVPVNLVSSEPGEDLERAVTRAQQKGRGRYAPGACY